MGHDHDPSAAVVADSTALDFVNSIPKTTDGFDPISDGISLLEWMGRAKLVPRESLKAIEGRALVSELDQVAERARNLREWFLTFLRGNMGRPLAPSASNELAPLNRLLEISVSYNQIIAVSDEDRGFALRASRRQSTPDTLLHPIGETLAKFVCEEDFSNVKMCEGQNCSQLFADHTRRRSRRWCSMAICGNRAKVQAHRDRAKQAQTGKTGGP